MQQNTEEPTKERVSIKRIMSELVLYIIIILLCVFVVPKYVMQRTVVKGISMQNTLQNGESLIVEKVSYHFSEPDRFDIVVFYPFGKDSEEYYVKRVIGLPGETIQIRGTSIYINDELLDENYGKDPITFSGIASEPLTLGEDEFFLMGDNRSESYDSRYSDIGPITSEKLAGRVVFRVYPFNKIGIMTNK